MNANQQLRSALQAMIEYADELHGPSACDCDPSVGLSECAVCKARNALILPDETDRLRTEIGAWNRQYPLQIYRADLDCVMPLSNEPDPQYSEGQAAEDSDLDFDHDME